MPSLSVQLSEACPHWDAERWNRFLSLTPYEQRLEIQIYEDAGEPAGKNAWSVALAILEAAATLAGALSGISGAISAIRAVMK